MNACSSIRSTRTRSSTCPALPGQTTGTVTASIRLGFEKDTEGCHLVDRRTGTIYRSPKDSRKNVDIAYLGWLPRPDGRGSFLYLAGIHAPGPGGVIHYRTSRLGELYREVRTQRFSTLIECEFDPETRIAINSRRITPVYVHERRQRHAHRVRDPAWQRSLPAQRGLGQGPHLRRRDPRRRHRPRPVRGRPHPQGGAGHRSRRPARDTLAEIQALRRRNRDLPADPNTRCLRCPRCPWCPQIALTRIDDLNCGTPAPATVCKRHFARARP